MKPRLHALESDGGLLVFEADTVVDGYLPSDTRKYQPVTVVLDLPADFINAYLGLRSGAGVPGAERPGVGATAIRPGHPAANKEDDRG